MHSIFSKSSVYNVGKSVFMVYFALASMNMAYGYEMIQICGFGDP